MNQSKIINIPIIGQAPQSKIIVDSQMGLMTKKSKIQHQNRKEIFLQIKIQVKDPHFLSQEKTMLNVEKKKAPNKVSDYIIILASKLENHKIHINSQENIINNISRNKVSSFSSSCSLEGKLFYIAIQKLFSHFQNIPWNLKKNMNRK